MGYYLAPSLAVLRDEINQRWPGRDKASDGWIGDAAHQATRSDHNPNERGSVNALDVDKDGVDMAAIIAAFEQHPSAHYWIYRGQIADRDDGWRRRTYYGANQHDQHGHFSIRQTREAEQDTRQWGLEDDMPTVDEIWKYGAREYVDEAKDGVRDPRTVLDIVYATHAAAVRAQAGVAALLGKDMTDEAEVARLVLAGLAPEQIAAAIPPTLAKQVADELARRLTAS